MAPLATHDLRFFRTGPLIVKASIWIIQAGTCDDHRIVRLPRKRSQPRSPRIDSGERQRVAFDDGCLSICIAHDGNRVVRRDNELKCEVWIGTIAGIVDSTRPATCAERSGHWA
jgi:hypothetical protein